MVANGLNDYSGVYRSPAFGDIELRNIAAVNELVMYWDGYDVGRLKPFYRNIFEIAWADGRDQHAEIRFVDQRGLSVPAILLRVDGHPEARFEREALGKDQK